MLYFVYFFELFKMQVKLPTLKHNELNDNMLQYNKMFCNV